MSYSKVYGKIIEELRKSKKMSVSALCEDIMSERTYYRYMKEDLYLKYDVFTKLAHRLNIDPQEAIHFSVFVRKGDPGVTRFIYRVNVGQFFDIEEIYQKLETYHEDIEEYDRLLQAYIHKYQFLSNRISKEEYFLKLNQSMDYYKNISINNIYALSFYALYLEQMPSNEYISITEFVEKVVNFDHSMGILLYMITIDVTIGLVLGKDIISNELFMKIVEKVGQVLQFYPQKYFMTRYGLVYVQAMNLQGKLDEVQLELYQTLVSMSVIFDGERLKAEYALMEKIFNIKPFDFMQEYSYHYLNSSQFTIKQ